MTTNEAPKLKFRKRAGVRRKRWFLVFSLAIIVLSTALQFACLKGGAVIDDKRLISDFEGRGCGANPIDCFHNMMFGFYYRPVLSASIAIGQKLHDNRPIWFHIENLALHILASIMALWMFRLIFKRRITALIAGLLFAIHPIQVCFTTFIGGRTESIVAISILLFCVGIRNASRRMALLRRVHGTAAILKIAAWIGASILGLLAAEFSKEQVAPLVLLAPLLAMPFRSRVNARVPSGRTSVPAARRRQPMRIRPPYWTILYLLPVSLFVVAAHSALHDIDFVEAPWTPALHFEMVGRTLWSYTKILLFPTVHTLHVTTLGAWEPPQIMAALMGYLASVIWIGLLVYNWRNRPRRILWLWASLGLFACINVIPVPTQFASAYRAGIPLFGFAGLVASLLAPDHLPERSQSAYSRFVWEPLCVFAVVAGMAIWCALVTYQDVPNWHDEIVLMKAEVSADPNFVCARAALASFEDQNGQFEDALPQFDRCLTELLGANASPEKYPEMIRNPAMVRTLQSASTLRYYRPVQYIPQIVRERGRTLVLLHRPAEALPDLRAALLLNPSDTVARAALELSYRELHQIDKAEAVRKMDDVLLGRKL